MSYIVNVDAHPHAVAYTEDTHTHLDFMQNKKKFSEPSCSDGSKTSSADWLTQYLCLLMPRAYMMSPNCKQNINKNKAQKLKQNYLWLVKDET